MEDDTADRLLDAWLDLQRPEVRPDPLEVAR